MTNDEIILFDTIRNILKRDYNIYFNDILNKVKIHLEEEYLHYQVTTDAVDIDKRIKQQSSRYKNIELIEEWLLKSKF